jgi:hypothetical protein
VLSHAGRNALNVWNFETAKAERVAGTKALLFSGGGVAYGGKSYRKHTHYQAETELTLGA